MIQYEFIKFVVVGLSSNLLLFVLYLRLTAQGMGYLKAMTLVYILGVAIGFVLNRSWTFSHKGRWSPAFLRYVLAYVFGYFFNLCMLYLFVDAINLPHQPVQGILILLTAAFLFLLQKYWVFRTFSNA